MILDHVARAHDHAVGRRALDREAALADLAQPQRVVERERMGDAGLVELGGKHPDVVGESARDLNADVEALGVDAVIVGDQDAHALGRGAARDGGCIAVRCPLVRSPLLGHVRAALITSAAR
jgi:hypothetical protein